jgi:hypothetical protein
MIKESIGDISGDEIKTHNFNQNFRKELNRLYTPESTTNANWAGIRAWNVSGDLSDGYFIVDAVSYKGGNDYNNIDYEFIHRYDDEDDNVESEILETLDNMDDARDFLYKIKSYAALNERSDFDAVSNIGKITKNITIELDLKHSMHSMERQGRSEQRINNSDIKYSVDTATEQIIDLLINNTLNAGDPVWIYNSQNNLNVVGTLLANKNSDIITFKLITVMFHENFYNKNKTYKVTI